MKKIMAFTFEADKGESIHNFADKLYNEYKKCGIEIVGLFNDIKIIVDQYENPMSLYWQYMYKMELMKK